jgi:hypothetical protein
MDFSRPLKQDEYLEEENEPPVEQDDLDRSYSSDMKSISSGQPLYLTKLNSIQRLPSRYRFIGVNTKSIL